jgi:PAS domain S-box-containing protein
MTIASGVLSMLRTVFPPVEAPSRSSARQFVPTKQLSETDSILVDMLNSQGHEDVCYCVCDPDLPDMPIIFASEGFCNFTGYGYDEIEGRNCRFLQGPETKREEVDGIRDAIQKEVERSVNLLNYRKDGTPFVNEFFISPLRDENKKLQYVRHRLMSTCNFDCSRASPKPTLRLLRSYSVHWRTMRSSPQGKGPNAIECRMGVHPRKPCVA